MIKKIQTKDIHEAMVTANHNFEVEMIPLVTIDGREVWDKQGVIRTDTGAYLGTVGQNTHHIQPVEFYTMADELLTHSGGEIYQVLTFGGGAVIGVIFRLDSQEYISGDPSDHHLIFLTSYDSSFAINAKAFNMRFVCLNMLANSIRLFSVKNTTHNLPRLQTATRMLKYYGKEKEEFDNKMRLLAHYKMSDTKAIDWFGNQLLTPPPRENGRANTIYDNQLDLFINLLQNGKGTDISGVRGTGYGVLNAVTEYCNHHRTTRIKEGKNIEEVRFTSNILGGSSDKLMQKALNGLLDIAAL